MPIGIRVAAAALSIFALMLAAIGEFIAGDVPMAVAFVGIAFLAVVALSEPPVRGR
jgi:hypothetical protein